jgi:hypothetical protein
VPVPGKPAPSSLKGMPFHPLRENLGLLHLEPDYDKAY